MVECKGDPACFAERLRGTVDARYLLVITASQLDEVRLVGARLIDLSERKVIGEEVAEVAADQQHVDVLPLGSLTRVLSERHTARAIEGGAEAKVPLEMKQEESSSLWWLWTGIAVVAVAGGATALAFALKGDGSPSSFCTSTVEGACD
jgi:hypothetical protein